MIVSFYTPGYYEEVAHAHLLPSVRALGIEYDIRRVCLPDPTSGKRMRNWRRNNHFKADYLRQMRKEHPGKDLLWVDCDAVVHRDPLDELRDGYADFEFAAHFLKGEELLAGTLWFPATGTRTDELFAEWRRQCQLHSDEWDGPNLYRAMIACRQADPTIPIRVGELPPQFCFIFDTMRKLHPGVEPIIEHFQASRALRRKR